MNASPAIAVALPLFEMRYASLFKPGRALAFPCDCAGRVDMDSLSDRARDSYLFARATVGGEYSPPYVCQATSPEPWQRL